RLGEFAGPRRHRLDRIHGQRARERRPAPARHHESHRSRRSGYSSRPRAAGKEQCASHRRAEARPRWQVATEPLRPGPDSHRIHGTYAQGKTLLLRIHGAPSQTMTPTAEAKITIQRSKPRIVLHFGTLCATLAPLLSGCLFFISLFLPKTAQAQ